MSFTLKITGCMLIVVSTTMTGFLFSQRLRTRCDFLTAFLDFLCNLEANIRFSGEDIFSLIDKSVNNRFLEILILDNSTKEYWNEALSKIPSSYGLKKEDYSLLRDFGAVLGTTDIEGQTSHIQLYKKLFESQLKKAQAEYNSKSKLYKVISFYAGSAVALMIL